MVLAVASRVGLAPSLPLDAPGKGAGGWAAPDQGGGPDPARGFWGQRENPHPPFPYRFLGLAKSFTRQLVWRKSDPAQEHVSMGKTRETESPHAITEILILHPLLS